MKKELWIRGDRLIRLFDTLHLMTFPTEESFSSEPNPAPLSWAQTRLWVQESVGISADDFAKRFADLRVVFLCLGNFFRKNRDRLKESLDVAPLLAMRGLNQGVFRALAVALDSSGEEMRRPDPHRKKRPRNGLLIT